MHHGSVGASLFILDVGVKSEVLFSSVHRCVGSVVGEKEEPWLVLFFGHPGHSFVAEKVGKVGRGEFGERFAIALEAIAIGFGEIAVASLEHTDKVIEAPFVRMELGAHPKVPLADEGCLVAEGLEVVGDGMFGSGEAEKFGPGGVFGGALVEVTLVSEAAGIAAGEESGAGGGADRGGDIPAGAQDSAVGEGVELRSLDGGGARAAEVAVSHVVGQDDEEFGLGVEYSGEEGEEEKLHEGGTCLIAGIVEAKNGGRII